MGCLVRYFEQQFSVFKQFKYHMYFDTLFHTFSPFQKIQITLQHYQTAPICANLD